MKFIQQTIFIIILCVSCHIIVHAQDLSKMSVPKRNSELISIAKKIVLLYGPDYFREYKPPVITKDKWHTDELYTAGRIYYRVTILYDELEEQLSWNYAAEVCIWEDSGRPYSVMFGNGLGFGFSEDWDWPKGIIEPMTYQDATRPICCATDEEGNIIPEPVNKDELLRKGWRKREDGQWERTRPDAPPAEAHRVIRQAQDDMRRREMNKR